MQEESPPDVVSAVGGSTGRSDAGAFRSASVTLLILFVVLYSRFVVVYGYQYLFVHNTDLPSFHAASVAVFERGESPYSAERLEAIAGRHVHPYLYPPPSLLFFYPLSLVTYEQARLAVLALNHALILLVVAAVPIGLLKLSPGRHFPELALSLVYALLFHPFAVTLGHGQVNALLLVLLLAFWLLARRGRPAWAGLFLALSIVLKTYPVLLLPLLLICRRWREAVAAVAWLAVVGVVSLVLLPGGVWQEWFASVLPAGGYGRTPAGLFSPAAVWNQSLNGFFARLFTESRWSEPLVASPLAGRIGTYVAAAAVLLASAAAVWQTKGRSPEGRFDRAMFVALPMMYLVAPFSWEHHLVYVLPTILALLTARCTAVGLWKTAYYAAAAGAAALLAMPALVGHKLLGVLVVWGLAALLAVGREIEPAGERLPGG